MPWPYGEGIDLPCQAPDRPNPSTDQTLRPGPVGRCSLLYQGSTEAVSGGHRGGHGRINAPPAKPGDSSHLREMQGAHCSHPQGQWGDSRDKQGARRALAAGAGGWGVHSQPSRARYRLRVPVGFFTFCSRSFCASSRVTARSTRNRRPSSRSPPACGQWAAMRLRSGDLDPCRETLPLPFGGSDGLKLSPPDSLELFGGTPETR